MGGFAPTTLKKENGARLKTPESADRPDPTDRTGDDQAGGQSGSQPWAPGPPPGRSPRVLAVPMVAMYQFVERFASHRETAALRLAGLLFGLLVLIAEGYGVAAIGVVRESENYARAAASSCRVTGQDPSPMASAASIRFCATRPVSKS